MRRAGIVRALVVALDVAAVVLGLWSAHAAWTWWKPHLELVLHVRWWELWLPNPFMPSGFVLLLAWILVLRQVGLYDPGRMTSGVRIAGGVSRASTVLLIVVMVLQFLLPDRTYSRFLILAFCGFSSLYIGVFRLVAFRLQRHLRLPIAVQPLAIVGVGADAAQMARRVALHGHPGFRLVGYVQPSVDLEPTAVAKDEILGPVSALKQIVNDHDLSVIVLASRSISREEALILATRADQMGLHMLQVPFTWGVASPRIDLYDLGGLQLIDLTTLAYPTLGEQLKRALDLVLVSIGGLLLLPLLVAVAIAIKLQDGGPVLFVQPRAGRGGRVFPFYKFRSMVVDAEARRRELEARNEADGALFKITDDPRITPLGRFIRKYSIDELPQLWNVIRGDMNLVGPRPLPIRDLEAIGDDPEANYWAELRHKVKPGITGPWQVSGRSDLGFKEMVQLDIHYVQNWSLWLDLLVLLRTIPAVLQGRGAK